MTAFLDWFTPRRRILGWIAAGYTSFAVAAAGSVLLGPRLDPVTDPLDRFLVAVQLAAGTGVVTMLVLQGLWRVADTVDAENPLLGRESERFRVNQRVLTNTIEQAAIFAPMFLALSVRMDPSGTWALPYLMGLWCTGRLLFWVGYQLDPACRAIGMDWTSSIAFTTAGWLAMTLF